MSYFGACPVAFVMYAEWDLNKIVEDTAFDCSRNINVLFNTVDISYLL